jgi:hypothetical protein
MIIDRKAHMLLFCAAPAFPVAIAIAVVFAAAAVISRSVLR